MPSAAARPLLLLVLLGLGIGLAARPAGAVLELDITEGVVEPMPIAISAFAGDDPGTDQLGRDIADVISADLERSGLFRPIDRLAFIQTPEQLRSLPRFGDWRQINAQALVSGTVSSAAQDTAGGELIVEFRLWDVFAGSQLRGLRFAAGADDWRRVAHKIADAVYERITGESGYFDTRIVYVAETGAATDRVKRLAIMDQDGANHEFLTDGGDLVLTPRLHPNGQSLAYMRYAGGAPQIYRRNLPGGLHQPDLSGGADQPLGQFAGMTFAPSYAPDGRRLALTVAEGGNSDLYLLDLASGTPRRLTTHPAIDTSPSFSPDGTRLVFNSDRAGTPQLYVMDADGGDVRRISFGAGHYGSPTWSPRGDLIAFTKIKDGLFHIGVMRPDGSDERLLTRSTLDDGPTWSPNGRVILFSRKDYQSDRTRLFSIDATGYNVRELPTPLDASDPDWSRLIP